MFAVAACTAACKVSAAGGHFAVDDAAILDPGQCQFETWFEREAGGKRTLAHVGPACRLGFAELSLNIDRTRTAGAGSSTVSGIQGKWARALPGGLSIGAVVATAWQDDTPHQAGSTVVLPLTWQPAEGWQIHVNGGRDFVRDAPDSVRAGMAVEWTATPACSFIAERFREQRADRWRLGARYLLTPAVNMDLSRTQGLGDAASSWTLGLTWAFER